MCSAARKLHLIKDLIQLKDETALSEIESLLKKTAQNHGAGRSAHELVGCGARKMAMPSKMQLTMVVSNRISRFDSICLILIASVTKLIGGKFSAPSQPAQSSQNLENKSAREPGSNPSLSAEPHRVLFTNTLRSFFTSTIFSLT